jgi:hypothetical protein
MRIKVLVAPILVGLVSIAHAQVAPSDNEPGATAALHDVSGTYASTWGVMTLHQNGNHVIGSYTFNDGQIDGTFDGTRLRFSWREEGGGAGFGVFVVRSDGQLDGSWGVNDDHSSGAWTATLGSATDLSNNLAASPFGDSKLHAGSWPVEVYMPWDGTFADDNVWIGMVGVGVGLGNRITPDWYLGVTADYEMLMGAEGGNWDAPINVPDLRRRARRRDRWRSIYVRDQRATTTRSPTARSRLENADMPVPCAHRNQQRYATPRASVAIEHDASPFACSRSSVRG